MGWLFNNKTTLRFPEGTEKLQEKLNNFLIEKVVTKDEALTILKQVYQVDQSTDLVIYEKEFDKFLLILRYLQQIKIADAKIHQITVKRILGKKNGFESVNELYVHDLLSAIFPNYELFPLWSDDPDGLIKLGGVKYPVEIKTRTLGALNNIESCFEHLMKELPRSATKDVCVEIHILQLYKTDIGSLQEMSDSIKRYFSQFNDALLNTLPDEFMREFSNSGIHLNVFIAHKKTVAIPILTIPKRATEVIFLGNIDGVATRKGFITQRGYYVIMTAEVKHKLTKAFFDDCLKSKGKNFPPEPRVIGIYSAQLAEPMLKFVKKMIEEYTSKNKGTIIIGVPPPFHVDGQLKMTVSYHGAGINVKHAFAPYLNKHTYDRGEVFLWS